MKRLKYVLYQ